MSVCLSIRPSVVHLSASRFSFQDDSLSKLQWIFTKLGMCIDIVDIWFGITNWSYLPETRAYFCFQMIT